MERFVSALIREIKLANNHSLLFDTLYFGGGTPSVLPPAAIASLIEAVQETLPLQPEAEITIEVNPGTLTHDHFRMYRDAGVNRLNIGVQSFCEDNLRFLGRVHSADEGRLAIKRAISAGFDNIGLDLIFGLPGQSETEWQDEIAGALAFEPAHLSCYLLTFEPGTPLDQYRCDGRVHPLSEDLAAKLFSVTHRTLSTAGYEHYEISNFAKGKTRRSWHNQKYWLHAPYLGFGPAAHSFLPPQRKWNLKHVTGYIERLNSGQPPAFEAETLSGEQLMIETIYLGLRQSDGVQMEEFNRRFNVRFADQFRTVLEKMSIEGYLSITNQTCALTPKGMLYADTIAAAFAEWID
jgi:oxygen-independent coproporphyrinogen-3 oxidase